MNGRILGLGVAVLIAIGIVAFFVTRSPSPTRAIIPPPAATSTATPQATPAEAIPADCLLPGPAPVPPDGNVATKQEMTHGHDVIQSFVVQLEAYQTCRNKQADAPNVPATQKQAFIDQGNAAIDQANALAQTFGQQIAAYSAAHPSTK